MRHRVNGMFVKGPIAEDSYTNNAKDLLNHNGYFKKKIKSKIKKRPGRKRKYDIIAKYSDLEEDINQGKKIFKITKYN